MVSALQRWSGPLLALPGLLGIALMAWQAPGERSMITGWVLTSALSIERILPLLGLGLALALLDRRQGLASPVLLLLGTAMGFKLRPWFMTTLSGVPQAADHLFLTGPFSNMAVGLLLIVPQWARTWLFAPVALFVGAMLAIAIGLTDPTVNELVVSSLGVAIGVWIVSSVALTMSAIHHPWFSIAARIAGSWLLAAGLLYGSASLIPRPATPAQPQPATPQRPIEEAPFDGPGNGLPGLQLRPGAPEKPADSRV